MGHILSRAEAPLQHDPQAGAAVAASAWDAVGRPLAAPSRLGQHRHGEVGGGPGAAGQTDSARQFEAIQHSSFHRPWGRGGEGALDTAAPARALAAAFSGHRYPQPFGAFEDALAGRQRDPNVGGHDAHAAHFGDDRLWKPIEIQY